MPVADLRHIVAMFVDVELVLDELISQPLFFVTRDALKPRNTVEHVARQVKPVEIIQHSHVERRGRGSFFLVSTDVQVVVISAPVGQAMNEVWIAMEGKNNRLVSGENGIEVPIRQAMRVFTGRL